MVSVPRPSILARSEIGARHAAAADAKTGPDPDPVFLIVSGGLLLLDGLLLATGAQ